MRFDACNKRLALTKFSNPALPSQDILSENETVSVNQQTAFKR
jgi:hypothetical protein